MPDAAFDEQFEAVKTRVGVKQDVMLGPDDLRDIGERFLKVVQQHTGRPFPSDPYEQLEIAIKAVFNSWMGKRAIDYRREFRITPAMANGTAVNVVTMVFGNMGNDSATGVGFTRNPATGENQIYGEYLDERAGRGRGGGHPHAEADRRPGRWRCRRSTRQLVDLRNRLERHYREVQDFEFTIERGTLYCLQTRNGKMNAASMVRTSVEMHEEGLLSREDAILRVNPAHLEQMLFPRLDPKHKAQPLATGLPASPGAASGQAVFDADRAETLGRQGSKVILVREETKPEDIHGFFASQGILTSRGGKTSHAAVVARGMGKPCVAGAEGIHVDVAARLAFVGDQVIKEGDVITIDGSNGRVFRGEMPTVEADFSPALVKLLGWADAFSRLGVRANADTPRRRGPRHPLRREGHRPVPHRAHVQRGRPAADRAWT